LIRVAASLHRRAASAAALLALAAAAFLACSGCAGSARPRRSSPDDGPEDRAREAALIFDEARMPAYGSSPLGRLSMDGEEWTARALELIGGAKDYILVCSFLLTEHPNAERVLEALAEARGRGVRVRILVDSASYFRTYPRSTKAVRASVDRAKELGIPIAEYNPIRGRRVFTLFGLLDRDHRKFWVVDGRIGVVGGQNVDFDSLRSPEESGCIDAMAEFESPGAIAELRDSFVTSWNSFSLERIAASDFPVAASEPDASTVELRLVDQGPPGGAGKTTAMFDAVFARAGEELWMIQCYTFLTPALLARIRGAIERGVDVNIVLSAGHIASRFSSGSYYGISRLIDAGARVYIYESPKSNLLHYKMMMADDAMAAIGSANYNFRSQVFSREVSVVFTDAESLALVRDRLGEIKPYLRRIGAKEALAYRNLGNFLSYLLMQVAG
jgi:cardiolipin synthase